MSFIIDHCLEGGRRVGKAEVHHQRLKEPSVGMESGLPFVTCMDLDVFEPLSDITMRSFGRSSISSECTGATSSQKCKFKKTSIEYHSIISHNHIEMDPVKVTGVATWPALENKKDMQQFLGFTNFYLVLP
jgi:hypothetical protein